MNFREPPPRSFVLTLAGGFGVASLIVLFSQLAPSDDRVSMSTVLGLAAIASLMILVVDPQRNTAQPRVLEDGPTILRTADERDSGRIVDTIDDVVMENMGWTDEHRSTWATSTAKIVLGQHRILVITTRDSHQPIGVVSFGPTDDPTTLRLGTWLGAAGRQQGHMRRALRLIGDEFGAEGYSFRVETAADNEPMKHSLTGAGFNQIGSVLHRLPNGTDVDALIYARYAGAPADPPGNGAWGPPAV